MPQPPAKILGPDGRPVRSAPPPRSVRGRYDAAQTTDDNRRHWAEADALSARAANDPAVRRTLRMRARYEAANNSYCRGIVNTLANDTVGTGPRLQLQTEDAETNRAVESAFCEWTEAIGLAEKLRTMRQSRVVDGEAFGLMTTNPLLSTPVKLDLKLIEADQIATPYPVTLDPLAVDGIRFDKAGNPTEYYLLRGHPGDTYTYAMPYEYDLVPASLVVHWFRADRPGQVRGVPEITPALPLFAQLRRYTLAVLAAAETAADFAAVLFSEMPPDGETIEGDPFETLEITKRMMTTLPAGWKLSQLKAEQPATTYEMFKREILNEIARCLNVPYNIAAGNSSSYNYSSGRLDHQTYYRSLGIDQGHAERVILNRLFAAWLAEAARVPGAIGAEIDPSVRAPRQWLWPGLEHVDPEKEANAQGTRLANFMTSFSEECHKQGVDPDARAKALADDFARFRALGLPVPAAWGATPSPAAPTAPDPAPPTEASMNNRPLMIRASALPQRVTLRASAPVEIDLEAARGDGKRPTFAITGYTGAPMNVAGFYSPVIVDLTGLKAASQQIPALREHDTSRIVGQTESVSVGSDGAKFTGVVTGDNADAAEVITQAKNGFRWQASIGAGIDRREFLDAGKRATVNGREVVGPMVIAREATLYEISFVAIGADGQTSASVAASQSLGTLQGANAMNFEQWLQAKGFDPAALSDGMKATLKVAFDAEHPAPVAGSATPPAAPPAQATVTSTLDQILAEQRREDDRVQRITDIAARTIRERPMLLDAVERLARTAISVKATTPDEFELSLLRATRAGAPSPAIHTRDSRVAGQVIEAAVCLSGRLDSEVLDKAYDQQTINAAMDRFPTGIGLRDLILIAARENGYSGAIWGDVREVLQAAFARGNGRLDVRADGFSTLSLPNTLANVANKFLIQGFMAVETGWREIAKIRAVRDFKATSTNALTGGFVFEKVGAAGELKHATVGEKNYTNQADTYGKIFAITRKDIINDDLGALTEVPGRIGRGAALVLNETFWTAFLATRDTFWASGNSNLISGGTTVLSSTSLGSALSKFRKQTDPDGKPLGITPRILLVPPELEITADELMTSTFINTGGSSSTDKVPNRNVWNSKFRTVMSSYLSNSAITNYSTTHWFLLADPMDLPTIEVAFLNGRDTPVVESADAEFDTLGIQMRGYYDFGVSLQEYRASVRSAGA